MLVLVASEPREFSGVLKCMRAARSAGLTVDWSRVGTLGGSEVLLITNGAGVKRAAAAVDSALERYRPRALVSTGFCGALDEKLRIADIVEGHQGRIYTADHVVRTASEKAALRATGAIAVEMEAAGVAARAEALGIPFHCVKSVTDLAGETLANDFNAALRPDGHFDTMVILRESLRRPTERLPELLRLRNRCARAARALGEFFADCRF